MKIIGTHGIRSDGRQNIDLLLADLGELGWQTSNIDYPRVNFLTARSRRRQFENGRIIFNAAARGDAVVAHSYGCLATLRAMELGAEFSIAFFFNPAMNADFVFPYLGCREVHIISNPHDRALAIADLLVLHDFGDMGRKGYQGPPDPRVVNIQQHPEADEWLHHSTFALPENRGYWIKYIDHALQRVTDGARDS